MQDVTDTYNVCEGRGSCESASVSSLDMLNRRAMSGGGDGNNECAVEEHRSAKIGLMPIPLSHVEVTRP